MNYASIGSMPEFQSKFEEIKKDVAEIEAKVADKIDATYLDSAKTAQFKPQKAGVNTINAVINPDGTDEDAADKAADTYTTPNFSCDEVKEALSSKYARKFNTIKSFLNLRFA
jgi:tryptophanyl-tRNA synthetase